jgi:hypothetical protein
MTVPLCGSSSAISITGISLQVKFVPDSGYSDFPSTKACKAILSLNGTEIQDTFTSFGGHSTWGQISNTFSTGYSADQLKIQLQAMDYWQGTVYIDNVNLTP